MTKQTIIVVIGSLRVNLDKSGFYSKIKNRMTNSVFPDVTAHYEQLHLDLHCLHRYLFWVCKAKKVLQ